MYNNTQVFLNCLQYQNNNIFDVNFLNHKQTFKIFNNNTISPNNDNASHNNNVNQNNDNSGHFKHNNNKLEVNIRRKTALLMRLDNNNRSHNKYNKHRLNNNKNRGKYNNNNNVMKEENNNNETSNQRIL